MIIKRIIIISVIVILPVNIYCQEFSLTKPKLEFDGSQLTIYYSIKSNNPEDKFYVWIEAEKKNGIPIKAESLLGDIGQTGIGDNKEIRWNLENDSVFLDEEVNIEVKAERYNKSISKGAAIALSTILPGLGQTKLSNGKPYWIIGIGAYGTLAGGLIYQKKYNSTYQAYLVEEDPANREQLLNQAKKESDLSNGLLISASAIWAINLIWTAVMPVKYKPLQHLKLSVNGVAGNTGKQTLLTLKIDF